MTPPSPRPVATAVLGIFALAGLACRNTAPDSAACTPSVTPEVWVERRYPSGKPASDTTAASLAVRLAAGSDSLTRVPPRSMISVLIAGPSAAERPDTVRLITTEEPERAPLWRGDQIRPGSYSASLTAGGFAAGPREFAIAPGERVELEVTMRHASGCPAGR